MMPALQCIYWSNVFCWLLSCRSEPIWHQRPPVLADGTMMLSLAAVPKKGLAAFCSLSYWGDVRGARATPSPWRQTRAAWPLLPEVVISLHTLLPSPLSLPSVCMFPLGLPLSLMTRSMKLISASVCYVPVPNSDVGRMIFWYCFPRTACLRL